MNITAQQVSYKSTNFFSNLVTDYIEGSNLLKPFYANEPCLQGIKNGIKQRLEIQTNRKALVAALYRQYEGVVTSALVKNNIEALALENTFTVTTAHQPNLFTGHLYFIYKILHAIKLCATLKTEMPQYNFVPVYYMGSEDADLEELGHVFINGIKHIWQTNQTGAVGRMKVDKALVNLINTIAGEVTVQPFGAEIIAIIKASYQLGTTIEQATFLLVNELFKEYGLVVLLPDYADLKKLFSPIVEKELIEAFSNVAVQESIKNFPDAYKVQTSGREINLFYLIDDSRERIEKIGENYLVNNSTRNFTKQQILQELQQHPERFSANVILRPVFQEMILPNIAFIGGGGELGYWLELKKVFNAVDVPYPILVLRNSFLIVEKKQTHKAAVLGFNLKDLFTKENDLIKALVIKQSALQLSLTKEIEAFQMLYEKLKIIAGAVTPTLATHTQALQINALKKIAVLEKKMLKAEKKKYDAEQRQLHQLKSTLFPNSNLQERIENFIPFYAKWGKSFFDAVYKHSLALEQEFMILEIE